MKTLLAILVALIGFSLVAEDADARRFGGGRNLGMQRSAPDQKPAAPAQQQQQPQQQQQAAPAQQPKSGPTRPHRTRSVPCFRRRLRW